MQRKRRLKKRICASQLRKSPENSCTNTTAVPRPGFFVVEAGAFGLGVGHFSSFFYGDW
jgi:hypothetical protein